MENSLQRRKQSKIDSLSVDRSVCLSYLFPLWEINYYSKFVSNCPSSFLIVLAVVFVVLVVVWLALGVVLELVEVVASHYCYRC